MNCDRCVGQAVPQWEVKFPERNWVRFNWVEWQTREMANRMQSLLFLLVLGTGAYIASGHVALTFPPARKFDLDFLDNSRTPAPCGMPKGELKFIRLIESQSNLPVNWATHNIKFKSNRESEKKLFEVVLRAGWESFIFVCPKTLQ